MLLYPQRHLTASRPQNVSSSYSLIATRNKIHLRSAARSGRRASYFSTLSIQKEGTAIVRHEHISLSQFIEDHFSKQVPCVITKAISDWPAISKWKDFNFLKEEYGEYFVPVEIGRNYLANDLEQQTIPLKAYLDYLGSNDTGNVQVYLAQHQLFEQIPQLKEDFKVPGYCLAGLKDLYSINAWLGPAGTVSPLHTDPHHNIFCQVVGSKYIRLYDPQYTAQLYPHKDFLRKNSSQIDLDGDPEQIAKSFPRFAEISNRYQWTQLQATELLYIPKGWWHYVRSLDVSFSVSFWFR